MNSEKKYLNALNKCSELINEYPFNKNVILQEYSCIPCDVAQELIALSQENKELFLELSHKYSEEAKKAFEYICKYATRIQSNTFQRKSSCWGTVGDHCTYVIFMLLPATRKFTYFVSFSSPEKVYEAMEGFWKHEINLKFILEDYYKNKEEQKKSQVSEL